MKSTTTRTVNRKPTSLTVRYGVNTAVNGTVRPYSHMKTVSMQGVAPEKPGTCERRVVTNANMRLQAHEPQLVERVVPGVTSSPGLQHRRTKTVVCRRVTKKVSH